MPGYAEQIGEMCQMAKAHGRADGAFIGAEQLFTHIPELADVEILSQDGNAARLNRTTLISQDGLMPLDRDQFSLENDTAYILYSGDHYASALVQGNDIFVFDSIPGHTRWGFPEGYEVHYVPVSAHGVNNCAAHAAVNYKYARQLAGEYRAMAGLLNVDLKGLDAVVKEVQDRNRTILFLESMNQTELRDDTPPEVIIASIASEYQVSTEKDGAGFW